MMGTEKSFDSGETVLNYFEGPKSGPPLIILHGLTSRHQAFEPLYTSFLNQWQVFAFDLRGHGSSGRTPGHYRVPDFASDIIKFVKFSFSEPVVLIGHSMGAVTVLEVASQIPERVRALVPLDPPLFLRDLLLKAWTAHAPIIQFFYQMKKDRPSFAEMITALHQCPFDPPIQHEAFFQELAIEIDQLDIDAVFTILQNRFLECWDLEQVLQKITSPMLHIYGDWSHGSAMRDEDVVFFKANQPHAVEVKIPDTGHMFPLTLPKITAEIIQTFLNSLNP
jgi:pimeloyl-ACP methyl ester carboxylesterase